MVFFVLGIQSIAIAQEETTVHTVQKGETVYQLSRKYKVNPKKILELNPQAGDYLEVGQELLIPQNNVAVQRTDDNNYIRHRIKKGETIYKLSRQYNVSPQKILQLNPTAGDNLSIGQYLLIPQDDLKKTEPPTRDTQSYTVQKGDTKFSLAKKYNISIDRLEELNPQIVPTLYAGSTISVPLSSTNGFSQPREQTEEPEPVNAITTGSALANVQLKRLAILVSFSEQQYQDFLSGELDLTYNPGLREEMLLFKGARHAQDSLVASNSKMDIKTFYEASSKQANLRGYSLFYSPSLKAIGKIEEINPAIVVTNNLPPDHQTKPNQALFVDNRSPYDTELAVIDYATKNANNIIMVSDYEWEDFFAFVKARYPSIHLLTKKNSSDFSEKELEELLKADQSNFIIFNTGDNGLLLKVTTSLLQLSGKYEVKTAIINKKYLPGDQQVSAKRFKILDLAYPRDTGIEKVYKGEEALGKETFSDLLTKWSSRQNATAQSFIDVLNNTGKLNYEKDSRKFYKTVSIDMVKF